MSRSELKVNNVNMNYPTCCEKCQGIGVPVQWEAGEAEIVKTCSRPSCHCHSTPTTEKEGMIVVPSPRIDWCGDCGKEHGYDCPKDTTPTTPETPADIEQPIAELERYVETNWQDMNGGDLVDIDPKKWLRTAFTRLADKAREEERHRISVEVEKMPRKDPEKESDEYDRGMAAALTRVQEIINPKQNDV